MTAGLSRSLGQVNSVRLRAPTCSPGDAAAPNQKWLTDMNEFQIPAGNVHLSPIIDCFDGLYVSWPISSRPNAELVVTHAGFRV